MMLSVVLAVNKIDDYLPFAIRSILEQSFSDFEFVIVANNCTDSLWNYLLSEQENDERIKLYRTCLGQLVFNLNYGVNIARGKYIARMDADDISLPDRLKKQVDFLEQHPDVNLCSTNFNRIDENGHIITESCQIYFSNDEIRKILPKFNPIVHPSIMFRREDFLARKGYLWSDWAEDYEYHLRCLRDKNYKFHALKDILLHYRVSSTQMTAQNNGLNNYANECSLMYREYLFTGSYVYIFRILRLNLSLRKLKRIMIALFRK
ncbi:glycosyltransferase [Shewanella sp. Koi 1]